MLRLSLITLLRFNAVDRIVVMYADTDELRLRATLSDIGHGIEYYPFDYGTVDQFFPHLPNVRNARLRYPSLMRWFLGRLPLDDFWYCDTDLLFAREVRSYLTSLQEDNIIVTFNRKTYTDGYKKTRIGGYQHTSDPNAGLMYFNAKRWSQAHFLSDIVEYYRVSAHRMQYVNQSALAWLMDCHRDVCRVVISDEYNIKLWDYSRYEQIIPRIAVHHFNGEDKRLMWRVYNDIMSV